MILITGAGGKTGRAAVKAIAEAESVCAFVHQVEHESALRSFGAEKVIVGDMRDAAAIRTALQGIRAVYHICPNMSPDEVLSGKLMIEGAIKAGVEHIVYHSVLHPQTEKMAHHWQKLRVEEMILESGLPFTILQPAPYMQNLLSSWKQIVEEGVLCVPYSVRSKFSFVDLNDVAAAARLVLTESGYENANYELAGTLPTSHREISKILGRVLNRNVRAKREEIRDWRLRSTGLSDYASENLVRMFEYYDRWGLVGNPNILRWILKRDPTSLEEFIERTRFNS